MRDKTTEEARKELERKRKARLRILILEQRERDEADLSAIREEITRVGYIRIRI